MNCWQSSGSILPENRARSSVSRQAEVAHKQEHLLEETEQQNSDTDLTLAELQ